MGSYLQGYPYAPGAACIAYIPENSPRTLHVKLAQHETNF
jgi:hypothetical protein